MEKAESSATCIVLRLFACIVQITRVVKDYCNLFYGSTDMILRIECKISVREQWKEK